MRRHLLFVIAACVLCALTIHAQSGRKQKKADPTPPVQGVNQPETRTVPEATVAPEESEKPKKDELKTLVQVMSELGDINVPMYYTDTARIACVQELNKHGRNLGASDAGNNKTRVDAMNTAKNNDNVYVVLIELRIDQMSSSGLDLRYTLFEPKTGKQIAFGSGYPRQPSGTSIPIGASRAQVAVDWAARDAAERVLDKIKSRPQP